MNKKALGSIWLWWLVLTFTYIVFNVAGYPMEEEKMEYSDVVLPPDNDGAISISDLKGEWYSSLSSFAKVHPLQAFLSKSASFIGIFVPFGLASLVLFAFPLTWFTIPVFFILMFTSNAVFKEFEIPIGVKIFLILITLIVITTSVDFVRGTPLQSWIIFSQGTMPHSGF